MRELKSYNVGYPTKQKIVVMYYDQLMLSN